MRPGMHVWPRKSTTVAPAGAVYPASTRSIFLPSTTMVRSGRTESALTSTSAPHCSAIGAPAAESEAHAASAARTFICMGFLSFGFADHELQARPYVAHGADL